MYPWTRHGHFLVTVPTESPKFSSDPLQQPFHQKPVSLARRGQELRFKAEVSQEEGGFRGAFLLHLLSPPPPTFPANDKWQMGGRRGKWLLAHRVSYLLISNPDSQVYAIPAHSGKTKYIEFGSGC